MRVKVLMLTGIFPDAQLTGHFADQLRDLGADVWLAGMTDIERTHADLGLSGLRSLRVAADTNGPEFHRRLAGLPIAEEIWQHVRTDDWVMNRADRADVLVALDSTAVYAVWELARRNPYPAAVFGLTPALTAVRDLGGDPPNLTRALRQRAEGVIRIGRRRARHSVRDGVQRVAGSAIGRSSAAGDLGLRLVAARSSSAANLLALSRIAELEARGRMAEAERSTTDTLDRLTSARGRANFLGSLALRHIAAGEPAPQLKRAVEAELAYADQLWSRGRPDAAAASFSQAVRIAFHRGIHFDATHSPLADDPAGFLEPFRRSAVARELNRPRGRQTPAAVPADGGTRRVLLATLGNTNFLKDITSRLTDLGGVEIRVIPPLRIGPASTLTNDPRRLIASLLAGDGRAERAAETGLRPYLDWADVVFVDWCTSLARVFQLVDPGTTRMLVRLHSYEAFTPWPLLLDLSRLDQLVFVSEHLRDLVLAQRPELAEVATPVLTNGIDLQRFVRPKVTDARWTVAVVGYSAVAKDVLWAIEAVRALRERDSRYQLLLIGGDFQDHFSAAAARYGSKFRAASAMLMADGGLRVTGHVSDVPAVLSTAGTILCSSVREGSPVGLLEAAASGCVPVVRDWPFFAGQGRGARALYPAEWIVDTPMEAADRIFRVTCDEEVWRAESLRCSTETIQHWDISAVGSAYDDLFGSAVPPVNSSVG